MAWVKKHPKSIIVILLFITAVSWQPIADNITLSVADPVMVQLSQDAGMSRKGELLFLRTSPELVSDDQMKSSCASNTAANNSNGFIEQGCYDTSTNRIYIRKMPDDLYNLEVATAAYEMLHPAYISLAGTSQSSELNSDIEENYTAINDSYLNGQVSNFEKTEPGAKDLELFSLLGTGYSGLSSSLASFYAPYFDNIQKSVNANNQVLQLFSNDESQLSALDKKIKQYNSWANTAYQNSVDWAYAGDQYETDYNYNIYKQDIDSENSDIDQYNTILDQYNYLVSEYNGSQLSSISPVKTEGQ